MIIDKTDYLNKILNPLNDTRKFQTINLKNGQILNFTVIQEIRVDNVLKKPAASNIYLKKQVDLLNE